MRAPVYRTYRQSQIDRRITKNSQTLWAFFAIPAAALRVCL